MSTFSQQKKLTVDIDGAWNDFFLIITLRILFIRSRHVGTKQKGSNRYKMIQSQSFHFQEGT